MHPGQHLAAIVFLVSLGLTGCASDHRKDIAFHVLFSEDGSPNAEAFSLALSARIPSGSSVETLRTFVERGGGSCEEREAGHLWCEFVTRAKYCAASMLGIDVTLQSGAVGRIKVVAGGLGC